MDRQITRRQSRKFRDALVRWLGVCLSVILLLFMAAPSALAEDTSMSFAFELTVDGKDVKEVKTGDIITVVLRLKRTDVFDAYTMYAMQDEIRYDSTFFELVKGSVILNTGIVSTDIALVDNHREFYMNYLSMGGGTRWESDMLIGSFQLKVIGTSGATKITNEDYLVSVKDGSDRYKSEANGITVVLSTDCTVSFETNGGTPVADQIIQYGEKITRPEDPLREGYELEGWYKDIHLTEKWDFDEDAAERNMTLYAKWVETESEEETESERETQAGTDVEPGDSDNGFCWWWIILLILLAMIVLYIYNKRKSVRG